MDWFLKKWRIPSAFGDEQPRRGLKFDELPRVRELRKKYAQSSDEEVLAGFKNARVTDSVLRFFLYTEAEKRGITNKLTQEKHGKNFEFGKDELIIFRFAETCTRNYFTILSILFTITIYPMANYAGIFCALIFSAAINICIFIAVWKITHLAYVTNRRVVIKEDENIVVYLYEILSYEVMRCEFKMPATFSELFLKIHSILYNEHIITKIKKKDNGTLGEPYLFFPKEMKHESCKFCHKEIVEAMIHR